ncbi:biotin/lipoyl-containing protein [Cytophagales bacterium LB-30]|uniref:Biotin/lipoyl-containing protein n=1 Tax=Shiella aurantiaca TaxID=3058365 RepID=A0ABT8F7D7_9BACT|nr:biotin/lipoyl-containing protein [Shiella aurantiaca]MDN4166352.1 biotin/lipoyl-containing protein [Shiella aurantiaca]
MYQTKSSNGNQYTIEKTSKGMLLNNEAIAWDILSLAGGDKFHIVKNSRSYQVEVVKKDLETKTLTVKVNGQLHEVSLKDKYDLLLEKLGMNSLASNKVNQIKAPMPGLIFEIKVKEGDTVQKGDQLMILEAMKMENIIKSPGEGVIKTIKVSKGDSVEKNQVMILFA